MFSTFRKMVNRADLNRRRIQSPTSTEFSADLLADVCAPLAFKRRNIFTPSVDLPLALRAGRPTKSSDQKQKTNAERQKRFRAARRDELAALRKLARKNRKGKR